MKNYLTEFKLYSTYLYCTVYMYLQENITKRTHLLSTAVELFLYTSDHLKQQTTHSLSSLSQKQDTFNIQ